MEVQPLQQSPRIQRISKSALQFRLLIDSLRNNLKANKTPNQPQAQHQVLQPIHFQPKEESILAIPQNKVLSHSNNFLLHNQQQNDLKAKQQIEVGDRDKLKKKPLLLDNNPEIQSSHSKTMSKLEQSTQYIENKVFTQLSVVETSHKSSVNVSTQYQLQNAQPMSSLVAPNPRSDVKVGQIIKQNCKIQKNQVPLQETKKIREINENVVIQYCKNEKKISQKSTPSQIFTFFANLIISCGIVIKSPHIKKYKNCIYFGYYIEKDLAYEGFLYFYDGKIYYGQFYNGFKHGFGVELLFNQNTKMKGQFKEGHKTGKFYIQKPNQKYIGYLENGLYQGEGKLTKEDYVYEGMFDRGEKNGYGEEFYPKTGVKITGNFKNGVLEKIRASKSIPEIKGKAKSFSLNKQKEKDRLQNIRKKSLQKHNFRMNKLRERNLRDSEYQMQFQTSEQYNENKLSFNSSKLQVYKQPIQRLPKICHQFQYNNDFQEKMESIGSQHAPSRDFFPPALKPRIGKEWQGSITQRIRTNQFQQPLPTPCLTVLRGRR